MGYNHQKSRSQMAKQKMSMLDRRQMPSFDDEREQAKLFYKKTDEKGGYAYGFSFGGQEKFEEGNPETGVKGHYTFVDANGLSKRVDYIADKEGFRILNDQDGNRFKREVKPDLVKTRMSSYMDSSSLRHDGQENMSNEHMEGQDMYSNIMGRDMLRSNMYDNRMGQDMSSNLMGGNMMKGNMMGQGMSSDQMGRNMLRSKMYNNGIGQDISSNLMGRNLLRSNMYGNQMGRDMTSNMMTANLLDGNRMTSKMMTGRSNMMNNRMNTYNVDSNLLGQRSSIMGQRMEMERIPENRMVNQLF